MFWNDKQYFFPHVHAKFLVFSRLTVTEIKWITTHNFPHQHPLLDIEHFSGSLL